MRVRWRAPLFSPSKRCRCFLFCFFTSRLAAEETQQSHTSGGRSWISPASPALVTLRRPFCKKKKQTKKNIPASTDLFLVFFPCLSRPPEDVNLVTPHAVVLLCEADPGSPERFVFAGHYFLFLSVKINPVRDVSGI